MSLNDELKQLEQEILNSFEPDIKKQMVLENAKLFSSFVNKKPLKAGDKAPNILIRDNNLKNVFLDDLLREHNIVLSFFRGTWCPYCTHELLALAKINKFIENKGAKLIAISPELNDNHPPNILNSISFPLYTDLANKAANEFGLVFDLTPEFREIYHTLNIHLNKLNGENSWTLPIPATFIISKQGNIVSTYVNADYMQRMEPKDILNQLDLLQK